MKEEYIQPHITVSEVSDEIIMTSGLNVTEKGILGDKKWGSF